MKYLLLILSVSFLFFEGFSQHKPGKSLYHHRKVLNSKLFEGLATYYHNKFHGKRMSNGEIYRKEKFTAASNSIPLNRWIKVTNLRNKHWVIVKVTDRMHHKNKLLLDLSMAAAQKLRMVGGGKIKVKAEVLSNYHPPGK